MERTDSADEPEPGRAPYEAELARFNRLLRTLWSDVLSATAASSSDPRIGLLLATRFEDWLRGAGPAPCWWADLPGAPSFAPPPLAQPGIAGMVVLQELQHTVHLLLQCSQLQGQLAMHWNSIIRSALEKFAAQVRTAPELLKLTSIGKLYDLWIDCAEQAYADVVHTEEYCHTQAALVNAVTTLVLDKRRNVERAVRSWGMPTRSEFEVLRAQLAEVQRQRVRPQRGQKSGAGGKGMNRKKGTNRSKRVAR